MNNLSEASFFPRGDNPKGLLIVVSGPSGSGKGTVLHALFASRKDLFYSVSATTRAPRPGEEDGRQYFFLTKEQFEEKIRTGGMLEYACYCGNYYGTPRAAVEEKRMAGYDVVLEIEVHGAAQIKKACPDCVTVFIAPPSRAELERRLRGRGTEDEEVIRGRLEASAGEVSHAPDYDYIVINDRIEDAAQRLDAVLTAEKCRSSRFAG